MFFIIIFTGERMWRRDFLYPIVVSDSESILISIELSTEEIRMILSHNGDEIRCFFCEAR